ncbi:MAG: hypothetical protein IPG90_16855 [Bacteroidetes bacterium]|nr:hypothetical protein [Bacteroidota bacterium]
MRSIAFLFSFMRFIGHLKLIFKLIVSLMTGFGLMLFTRMDYEDRHVDKPGD